MPPTISSQPLLNRNLQLFVWFRVLFNARFYYPVFAILFFDFGLSPLDFYILNGVVWTLASILLEVPSGALADRFGRRTLLIAAAILMVLEMAVFCFTPSGGGAHVFFLFLINRILSGSAEAAASGADEALAYDSIPAQDRETIWPRVQSRLMASQSIAMIIALNVGAFCYGLQEAPFHLSKELAMRLPIFLCLISSLATLAVTLKMREPDRSDPAIPLTIGDSFRSTLRTAQWIWKHPAPFYIVLVLVFFDSIVRLFYTVASSYHSLIGIDPRYFGLIGTAANLVGLLTAPWISHLVANHSPRFNYRLAALVILAGLWLLSRQIPLWGVLVSIPLGMGMRHIHAASSQYLNRVTDSAHRATVLSFRGLAMMAFYGILNLFAIGQVLAAQPSGAAKIAVWDQEMGNEIIRQTSSVWWLWFVAGLLLLTAFRHWRYGLSINEIVTAVAPHNSKPTRAL